MKLPIIEASLVLSSRKIKATEITELVQITPTKERSIDDWPDAIKNNTNLPDESKPRNEWIWTNHYQECMSVNEALVNLIDHFQNNITNIVGIPKEFSVEKTVTVLIHTNSTNMPEIGLEIRTVDFLSNIEAPIYFDIYTY